LGGLLGGYCKISGMVDESMDKEQMAKPPQPHEYRSKTAVQRLLIISGGVIFNFILALIIYSMVLFTWGQDFLPKENAIYGAHWGEATKNIGLKNGDHVVSIDNYKIKTYKDVTTILFLDEPETITVDRQGEMIQIDVPEDFHQAAMRQGKSALVVERVPFIIDSVLTGRLADSVGIRKKDRIVGINEIPVLFYDQFADTIAAFKNQIITVKVKRGSQELSFAVQLDETATIGVSQTHPYKQLEVVHEDYGFFESIPNGISLGVKTLTNYVKSMPLIFTKEGATQIGGFGTIGGLFSKTWDWHIFWTMTAFLSVMLAFMNILPIPALDGGYILFILYEIIFRRKPSEKFLEYAVTGGFIILLALLVYANGNDLLKSIF